MRLKEKLQKLQKEKFSLRVRLTLLVTAELVLSVLVALGTDALLSTLFMDKFTIPLFVELTVVSLLIGIFVTSLLSRLFFDPIKKLGKAMDRVGKGDLSVQVETKSSAKEIQEIYNGFNLMTKELQATEILQSDFVSNVSHEFKTPINAIEGYATLLQGDNLTDEQKVYVEKIIFNTNRLSSLVGSILLLSKIENQSIPASRALYRLDEQIRRSLLAAEPMWAKKNIEFDVELDAIEYNGNERLLYHVWDNLIGNAIKFGPEYGLIKLRLTATDKKIIFIVEDNGPGISEEALVHIFDKFYQGDSSHKSEGNGLGLALAKKIVSLSDGEIYAENINGGGCRFTVVLNK